MLISKKMNAALNEQVGHEFGASLQYVAIASYFASDSLPVLAAHFYKQAEEERDHAMRIVKYVVEAGGHVEIPAVPSPKSSFKSVEEAIQLSLNWENTVTQQINGLMALAVKEADYISQNMLTWFTKEQLEEVSSMETLLKMVQRSGDAGLIYVESYLAGKAHLAEAAEPKEEAD
jgi:ferritin